MDDETKPLAHAVLELIRRMAVHYGLWFANAVNRFGIDDALAMEQEAGDRGTAILIERLCATLGQPSITDGLPAPLAAMQPAQARALLNALAVNWLVLDGVWFQAVEQREGMAAAKAVNDACWADFSPLEAARIKAVQKLPETGGLDALAAAFAHRLYAVINEQRVFFADDGALVLQMTKCRVQAARQRKGLADYPCKSGGVVEYTDFARTIRSAHNLRMHCLPSRRASGGLVLRLEVSHRRRTRGSRTRGRGRHALDTLAQAIDKARHLARPAQAPLPWRAVRSSGFCWRCSAAADRFWRHRCCCTSSACRTRMSPSAPRPWRSRSMPR